MSRYISTTPIHGRPARRQSGSVSCRLCLLLLFFDLISLPPALFAGGGPENAVVVVNAEDQDSLAVANEYIRLRKIPASNVVYLRSIPVLDIIPLADFKETILKPVKKAIEERKLSGQIDFILYSAGLPYSIDISEITAPRGRPFSFIKQCSVPSYTYLFYYNSDEDPCVTNEYAINLPWDFKRGGENTAMKHTMKCVAEKKWDEAERNLVSLSKGDSQNACVQMWLARCRSMQGKTSEALAALGRASECGFRAPAALAQDEHFESIKDSAEFKTIVEKMRVPVDTLVPTHGFKSSLSWKSGELAKDGQGPEGRRYMLSAMLAFTQGRGNTLNEALEYLRKSVLADGTRPAGTIYYIRNKDLRTMTRLPHFPQAVAMLREMGIKAEIVDGNLPEGKEDVQGVMTGLWSFKWKATQSTILPGAFCENMTSAGGALSLKVNNVGQTPLSEFLRGGAAGSSGTVEEPGANWKKFPLAYVHVHYTRGASLGEAFYRSVFLPFHIVLVGDALCRPWARFPEVTVSGLVPGSTVKGTLNLAPSVEGVEQIARFDCFVDGVKTCSVRQGETAKVDTTQLDEGWHELRVVAVSASDVETQGRTVVPFAVRKIGREFESAGVASSQVILGAPVRVSARMTGAAKIALRQNERMVGQISGAGGDVEIDSKMLGVGKVTIQPVAEMDDSGHTLVYGQPLELIIRPAESSDKKGEKR